MPVSPANTISSGARTMRSPAGLSAEILSHGAIGRFGAKSLTMNLFHGNEVEGAPANLWLRSHATVPLESLQVVPLLGPRSPLTLRKGVAETYLASGEWNGLRLRLEFRLAESETAWFWHLQIENIGSQIQQLDLIHVQDIALSDYSTIRLNEHYVSQYLDLSPLHHSVHGCMLAARQNLTVDGRHPWVLMGALHKGVAYATDALQVFGLALRSGDLPQGISSGLPNTRLQHEHALLAIQEEKIELPPGARSQMGFFGRLVADHPEATSLDDLVWVESTCSLPEANAFKAELDGSDDRERASSLFATAPLLASQTLDATELTTLFCAERRHEELNEAGEVLSFFAGADSHIVLRAKELCVQRPHGHILRSGSHLVPDESALTSTVWMGGVFHSMLTQGHVSINRFLSTVHSWLGLFRSHGQRVFVDTGIGWMQLGLPSAFEMQPQSCRWLYKYAGGLIEVRSQAHDVPNLMTLNLCVLYGPPVKFLVSHHLALGGDDGSTDLVPELSVDQDGVFISVPAGSELAKRFPEGGFRIAPMSGSSFAQVGNDGLLFIDGKTRAQPFACIVSDVVEEFGLQISGKLTTPAETLGAPIVLPVWTVSGESSLSAGMAQLAEIQPWYLHNALVHYLSPRGLEQYSGGGWGTRDVCQGPLEMLLALGQTAAVRDLLIRVFSAQNQDGDWPQWFSFFEREGNLRAGDSHGDVVFWPLVALARYLIASEDAGLLEVELPFFTSKDEEPKLGTVLAHVERALALVRMRCIAGTHLAAYWHGDWNDSLQPADPTLRERMCSAWTVTLHHQMLNLLAKALHLLGRHPMADALQADAVQVRADFQRLLIVDEVVAGYAIFNGDTNLDDSRELLLHPSDSVTGVQYTLLPMMHAILENMLSPEQTQSHLALIDKHLIGPDGARLFDAPMPYRGGPERLFQRAESSSFFGREIGVMYMHAHLRYVEMLAHVGMAESFLEALGKAHPILIRDRLPSANLRQANCYFSSSDAAFTDRYQAFAEYGRVGDGTVALDGGWRVYSGGPGIAIGLLTCNFLGWRMEKSFLVIDPVIPQRLHGMHALLPLGDVVVDVLYCMGPMGCAPTRVELNGKALEFTRRENPYRLGAAELDLPTLLAALQPTANSMTIYTA